MGRTFKRNDRWKRDRRDKGLQKSKKFKEFQHGKHHKHNPIEISPLEIIEDNDDVGNNSDE